MATKKLSLLLLSQLFSVLGTTLVTFMIDLYILDLTQSATIFGVTMALSMIGRLICLPFCGSIVDRFPKKTLMMISDGLYLVLTLCLVLVTQSSASIPLIMGLIFLLGSVSAIETPLTQASIPLMFEGKDVPKVTGIVTSIGQLGNLVGPILAGFIYTIKTLPALFLICAALFVIAILCELFLKIPFHKVMGSEKMLVAIKSDFKEMVSFMKEHTLIFKICTLTFFLNFLITGFVQVVIPYIARVHLQVSSEQYGVMNACFALGGLTGAVLYSMLSKKIGNKISHLLMLVSLLIAVVALPLSLTENKMMSFSMMIGVIAPIFALLSLITVHLIAYIQVNVDTAILGRLMAFIMIISALAIPLGQLIWGVLAGSLPLSSMIILTLMTAVLCALMTFYYQKDLKKVKIDT